MIDLCLLARRTNLPRAQLAAVLGVSLPTFDRYLRENRAPAPIVQLLEIQAGRMPWPGFERLWVCRGAIYFREGPDGLPAVEIPSYRMRLRQLDALEREVRRYRAAPAQFYLDFNGP